MPDQQPTTARGDARKKLGENLAAPDHGHDPSALLARAEKAEAALARVKALATHAGPECRFPDNTCVCVISIFAVRAALNPITEKDTR